ncbi:hypothetical protein ACLOJK_023222 [Asimina triloba]
MAAVRCSSAGGDRRAMIDGKKRRQQPVQLGGRRPGSSPFPAAATVASLSSTTTHRPVRLQRPIETIQLDKDDAPSSDLSQPLATKLGSCVRRRWILTLDDHLTLLASDHHQWQILPRVSSSSDFLSKANASDPTTGDSKGDPNIFLSALIQPLVSNQPCWMAGDSGGFQAGCDGLWRARGGGHGRAVAGEQAGWMRVASGPETQRVTSGGAGGTGQRWANSYTAYNAHGKHAALALRGQLTSSHSYKREQKPWETDTPSRS